MGTTETLRRAAIEGGFGGELIGPEHPGYDGARGVWNGMIDRRPALIARCRSAEDVAAAVQAGTRSSAPLSVRGGGHNVAGSAVCDAGLVIDLSPMRAVTVDTRTRRVHVQGGATIADLDRRTQRDGLAVPQGVVSETGVAGLTLGGGLGWLRRKHGLSCDNLVGAEVVTAAGEVVRATEEHNADLLWGLRGGGGNFGIVTTFEFVAHAVGPEVATVIAIYPWSESETVLHAYRAWDADAPDEISSIAIVTHAPPIEQVPSELHYRPVVLVAAMHSGNPTVGTEALRPLRHFATAIADLSGVVPYTEFQQAFDEDYPAHEMRYYWKSLYLADLDASAMKDLMELNEASPSPASTLDLWQLGGAMARVGPDDTAFGDRSARFLLAIEADWRNPADDDANIAWAREAESTMRAYAFGGEYVNFAGFHERGEQALHDNVGAANYERLRALKDRYDPANVFRFNHNVTPAGAGA